MYFLVDIEARIVKWYKQFNINMKHVWHVKNI